MACVTFPAGLFPIGNGPDALPKLTKAVEIIKDSMCDGCIAHVTASVSINDYFDTGFGEVAPEYCDKLTVYVTDGQNEVYIAVVLDPDAPLPADRISEWLLIHSDSAEVGTITGEIRMYSATADGGPPADWLFCDGSEVLRTTYSTLFSVIGTLYGVGDGSTTFNLPDLRGKSPMGVNDLGLPNGADGAYATRNEAAVVGAETHTLVVGELASHTHGVPVYRDGGGTNPIVAKEADTLFRGNPATTATGSNTPHATVQPNLIINFIIKT